MQAETRFLDRALDHIDEISPAQCVISAGIARDKLRDAARDQRTDQLTEAGATVQKQLASRFGTGDPSKSVSSARHNTLPAHDPATSDTAASG